MHRDGNHDHIPETPFDDPDKDSTETPPQTDDNIIPIYSQVTSMAFINTQLDENHFSSHVKDAHDRRNGYIIPRRMCS